MNRRLFFCPSQRWFDNFVCLSTWHNLWCQTVRLVLLDPYMPCTCTVAYAVWPSDAQLHFNSQDGGGSASQAGRPQKLQLHLMQHFQSAAT